MTATQLSLYLILTCPVYLHILHIFESSSVLKFLQEHVTIFITTSNVNMIIPPLILTQNSRPVHNTTSTSSRVPPAHVTLLLKHFVAINRFWTVRATLDVLWLYFFIFVTKNTGLSKVSVHLTTLASLLGSIWLLGRRLPRPGGR
jgi:hypothetical protein